MAKFGIISDCITIFMFVVQVVVAAFRVAKKIHQIHISKKSKK